MVDDLYLLLFLSIFLLFYTTLLLIPHTQNPRESIYVRSKEMGVEEKAEERERTILNI